MSSVRKSRRAKNDLVEIWSFISVESEHAADATLDKINAKLRSIADSPGIGRPRPEFGSRVRSFVVGRYLILYRPIADGIGIVRVLHGRRDLQGMFRR